MNNSGELVLVDDHIAGARRYGTGVFYGQAVEECRHALSILFRNFDHPGIPGLAAKLDHLENSYAPADLRQLVEDLSFTVSVIRLDPEGERIGGHWDD